MDAGGNGILLAHLSRLLMRDQSPWIGGWSVPLLNAHPEDRFFFSSRPNESNGK